MTRRDVREVRQGVSGMAFVTLLAATLTWFASCAPDPVYAQTQQQRPDGTAAQTPTLSVRLPIITGVRFAWPTPNVRAELVKLWRNNREFGACIIHVAVLVRDTAAVREETWFIDSIVPAVSRVADQTTLVDSTCPERTIGFIHSHPQSRVCNLSPGDVLAGALFQWALSGVVCGPDGSIGFAFNPLLPVIGPAPSSEPAAPSIPSAPSARLPPDTSYRAPIGWPLAPDEGSGS